MNIAYTLESIKMDAQHRLREMQEARDFLEQMEGIEPILIEAAKGKEIQVLDTVYVPGTDITGVWRDMVDFASGFSNLNAKYRVKPEKLKYRIFLYKEVEKVQIGIEQKTGSETVRRPGLKPIRYLNDDWLEIEV